MLKINTKFKNFIENSWSCDIFDPYVSNRRETVKRFKQKTVKKIRKYLKKQEY